MPKKKKSKKTAKKKRKPKKQDDKKLFAFLATFLSILGVIIALLFKKNDKYVMFYTKQSLIVFIVWIIVSLLNFLPTLGWILKIFVFVLWVISWIYALSGKTKDVPLVGKYAKKINFS